jgi:hypothetical protein
MAERLKGRHFRSKATQKGAFRIAVKVCKKFAKK